MKEETLNMKWGNQHTTVINFLTVLKEGRF
jgi:hypothetical protein